MDDVLRFVRCPGAVAEFCEYIVLWDGVCWYGRYGLGVVDQLVFYPVCGDGDGGVVL